jgi:hypothetical protein
VLDDVVEEAPDVAGNVVGVERDPVPQRGAAFGEGGVEEPVLASEVLGLLLLRAIASARIANQSLT